MNTSGLTVPPAVNGFQWEQCPDLDARQVFRLVGSDALWIVWQSNRYQAISAMSDDRSSIPSWHRISAETIAGELGGLPIAYLASSANLSKATWLAVQLVSISTLDQLIERFGQPPVEVQQDWTRQSRALSGKMVFGSNQLSHVIAMTDGRLISLLAIEAFLTRLDSSSVACIPMEFPLPALEERLQGLATRTDGYFQKTIDELLRVSSPSTAKADAKPSKNIKQSLLDPNEVKKSSKVATTSKPRSRKIRWGAVAAFGVLLVGVWTMLSLSRPKPVAQNNGTESTEPSTPIAELPSESLEAEFDSDVKLQLSPREPDPIGESLSEKANDSLSKILSGFGGSSNSDAIESISFESVEAILKNTDEAKIIEQSLGQSADGKSIEMQATTAPFGEPLDAPMAPEAADSSASTNATGTEPSNDIKSDVGFLTQSLSIKQALYKTTLKLPFKPNDRKAVCRVQLKLAADLLQNRSKLSSSSARKIPFGMSPYRTTTPA
ncbi:MAG: hypothetical protein SGI77_02150 [Pirellulaceae bacterium]|nr:hypothetical protein [Pirellulaceae bacterium]